MKKCLLLIIMLLVSSFVQASGPLSVNTSPVVALTSPVNQSTLPAGSTITITATASEAGGTIFSVTFYNGATLLGQCSKSPYSYTWKDVPAGTYTLTAVATDFNNVSTTSGALTITVTPAPPVVAIVSPANGSIFTTGSRISLEASASEFNGTIATVSFYNASTLLATSGITSSSYNYNWDNVPAGGYTLTAKATDINGVAVTSRPITVTVVSSSAPLIAITSPANDSTYTAGANITMTASVAESNGTIREVFFYDRTYYLGSSTASPYTYIWHNVPAGIYSLTVEATDNNGGTLIAAPVHITVNPALALPTTPSAVSGKKKKKE